MPQWNADQWAPVEDYYAEVRSQTKNLKQIKTLLQAVLAKLEEILAVSKEQGKKS